MLQVGHPGGLCNRLDVITTGYMLAERQGGKEIEFLWPLNNRDMPVSFYDLFLALPEGRIVERSIDLGVLQSYYAAAASLPADYRESGQYAENLRRLLANVVPEVEAEIVAFTNERFGAVDKSLSTVGVHVRRTERPYPICEFAQPLRYYEAVMRSFPEGTRFFVSTDCLEAFEWLRNRFGGRVFQREKHCNDRSSVAGVREGLIDMLLLSRCSAIIGTARSSFSHMSALAGGKPIVRVKAFPDIPVGWPAFSHWRWRWAYRHFLVESTFWRRWLFYVVRPHAQRIPKIPAYGFRVARRFTSRITFGRNGAPANRHTGNG